VILPYSNLNADLKKDINIHKNIIDYGISISRDNFSWHDNYCVVPDDLSVTYAIACASTSNAEIIYFAGLDGTCQSDFKSTENAIELYKKQEKSKKILSFTPTNYNIEAVPAIFGVVCE
jgi:4-hydroxy 2-oxovalerate aldolase